MSVRRFAEVDMSKVAKLLKLLAEVRAEVRAEVAEVRLQVIEIACGGLRRFCGGSAPLKGIVPPPLGAGRHAPTGSVT